MHIGIYRLYIYLVTLQFVTSVEVLAKARHIVTTVLRQRSMVLLAIINAAIIARYPWLTVYML